MPFPRMQDDSAGALAWVAVILIVLGLVVMSPTGGFFLVVLAAVAALAPLVFGSTKRRIFAGAVFCAATLIGIATYPEFRKDYDPYLERARQKSAPAPDTPPSNSPAR
jgi:cell division protein FtsW (lipid II flippase)